MNSVMNKYLPIGTVVMLKNAKKRMMIVGFAATSKETGDKMFDYIGCLYPEGVISSDQSLVFNHDQIDKVFYMGYSDDENKQIQIKLNEIISKKENMPSDVIPSVEYQKKVDVEASNDIFA